MGKTTKTGRLREKALAEIKHSKQTTFDNLPAPQKKPSQNLEAPKEKQIVITDVGSETKEDDLSLKVAFRLIPSKASFSKVIAELYFDGQKLLRCAIRIPQGRLSADDLEFPFDLDMRGIAAGQHVVRAEVFELWNSEEKLTCDSKEVTVDYVPIRRQDRYIKIPTVKKVAGEDVEVISEPERDVYREIEKDQKAEYTSKRDEW